MVKHMRCMKCSDGLLDQPGEHILLGDFNLHHPRWNNPGRRTTQHVEAGLLTALVDRKEMELALPRRRGNVAGERQRVCDRPSLPDTRNLHLPLHGVWTERRPATWLRPHSSGHEALWREWEEAPGQEKKKGAWKRLEEVGNS